MMTPDEKAAFLSIRCGKLTASNMWKAMSYLKNGQPSAARVKYMHELLAERVTGFSVPHYVTDAMQFGLDNEDGAIEAFEALSGRDVKPSRFYEHPSVDNFGATPDRELDDGLLEVKCPTSTTFIEWVLADTIPDEYQLQMTAQLLCAEKEWCGFIAFDPRIRDQRRQLWMKKFVPSVELRAQVLKAAVDFLNELDLLFDKFVSVQEPERKLEQYAPLAAQP